MPKQKQDELSKEERAVQEREELRQAAAIPHCVGCGREMILIEANPDGLVFVPFYQCPRCKSSVAPVPTF